MNMRNLELEALLKEWHNKQLYLEYVSSATGKRTYHEFTLGSWEQSFSEYNLYDDFGEIVASLDMTGKVFVTPMFEEVICFEESGSYFHIYPPTPKGYDMKNYAIEEMLDSWIGVQLKLEHIDTCGNLLDTYYPFPATYELIVGDESASKWLYQKWGYRVYNDGSTTMDIPVTATVYEDHIAFPTSHGEIRVSKREIPYTPTIIEAGSQRDNTIGHVLAQTLSPGIQDVQRIELDEKAEEIRIYTVMRHPQTGEYLFDKDGTLAITLAVTRPWPLVNPYTVVTDVSDKIGWGVREGAIPF